MIRHKFLFIPRMPMPNTITIMPMILLLMNDMITLFMQSSIFDIKSSKLTNHPEFVKYISQYAALLIP